MSSLEQSIKDQFAKVFTRRDWQLFKKVAEINLAEAAFLRKASFGVVADDYQLLIRNTRKRLLIGIGAELLVKAVYLKAGYAINKPLDGTAGLKPPFTLDSVTKSQLDINDTFSLAQLTDQLKKVIPLANPNVATDGLRIAKVFRNKEGHVVTRAHRYDPSSYRAIEAALVEIYACAFNETLTVRFSFAVGEKGIWRVAL